MPLELLIYIYMYIYICVYIYIHLISLCKSIRAVGFLGLKERALKYRVFFYESLIGLEGSTLNDYRTPTPRKENASQNRAS